MGLQILPWSHSGFLMHSDGNDNGAIVNRGLCACVQISQGDLSFLPWEDVYAMMLRMWDKREERGLDMAVKVYVQPAWRPGQGSRPPRGLARAGHPTLSHAYF
jgi:hypothetical protein